MTAADTAAPHPGRRLATLDIGTNTLLLLVAEQQADGSLRAIYEACEFGRLGQGLDRSGALATDAVTRSLEILRRYRADMDRHGVGAVAAVGTQALREARNRDAFTAPAAEILGRPIEIIAGEREAALVYQAVSASFPALAGTAFAIADVGGGSTEVVVADTGGVASVTSVPIGSVRLSERHLGGDPPTAAELEALTADIDAVLAPLPLPAGIRVVGTAGTATTMAGVALALDDYDPERVNGFTMSTAAVDDQLRTLAALSVAERRRLPGLEPRRADVIVAGAAIFARLLHRARADELLISDRGVRWGLAYELAAAPAL
ncbi:Ppx/GppA phosphatase family protein [Haliangium sp.]|uniref:Ppx/GppA phosphatase family protein n=1 Tax=Haliangium sp. TaxID=2663208 RepID=UPI003D10A4C3